MSKKAFLLSLIMFIAGNCAMQAQVVIENNAEVEEEEVVDEEDDEDSEDIEETDEGPVEFPEAMTYDLDSLLGLYMSKTYLSENSDCQMKDENPSFPPEVFIDRLSRMPTAMEMAYNDVVQLFIDRYAGRLRRSVAYMLGAANFYMPIFEEALETYNIPLELKYLPVIESALKPQATSRVGAAGLWQFMLTTGKNYGLEVNTLVDERRDPIKSSYAAAHYLSDLYKIFGDWNLVIAAYNCGPGNINKAILRSNGERDFWKIYPHLPRETRGYVPAFIAANYIMNYYCEHNICPMTSRLPAKTDTVMVSRNLNLQQIAEVCGLDLEMLRSLNPAYRRDIVPGANKLSAIRLPQTDISKFIENEDSIYNHRTTELLTKRAVVEVNDNTPTFTRSKARTRTSKARTTRSRRSSAGRASRSSGGKSITIRSGQTLSQIARQNGTTVAKLKQLNGIKGSNIRAGKKLRVK